MLIADSYDQKTSKIALSFQPLAISSGSLEHELPGKGISMFITRLLLLGLVVGLSSAATVSAAEPPRSSDNFLSPLIRDLTPQRIKQLGDAEGVQMLLSILSGEMP